MRLDAKLTSMEGRCISLLLFLAAALASSGLIYTDSESDTVFPNCAHLHEHLFIGLLFLELARALSLQESVPVCDVHPEA
jgi:hypothetical protein